MADNLKFTRWTSKRPNDEKIIPAGTLTADGNTPVFQYGQGEYRFVCGKYYNVGKWESWLEEVDDTKTYHISLRHREQGQAAQMFAVLFAVDAQGAGQTMDYLEIRDDHLFALDYRPVPGTKRIRLEVIFRCFGQGEASFAEPEVSVHSNPQVIDEICVGTTYLVSPEGGFRSLEEQLPVIEGVIDRAAADPMKPDILLFTETTLGRRVDLPMAAKAIPENDARLARICAKARQRKMHLVFSIVEKTENAMYNTACVIDDNGIIIGKYHKVQITYAELIEGLAPGESIQPIQTKFGKIGIVTCWDAWYPEVSRELCRQGAKVLFCPTAGRPEVCWQSRAMENGVPFVTAYAHGPEYCGIYSAAGERLANITDPDKGYVCAKVPMDRKEYTWWLGVEPEYSKLGACERNVHFPEIRRDLFA